MGVHGLWELLSPVGQRVSNDHVRNKVIAVDISIWLTQFVKAMRDAEGARLRNGHLLGVFRRCLKLLFLAVKPVLIFDGATPALKRRTLALRRAQRDKHAAKLRRLAENLVINQMKRAALATAVANRRKSKKPNSQQQRKVKSITAAESSQDKASEEVYDDEDRIEPNFPKEQSRETNTQRSFSAMDLPTQYEQRRSDELYAHELDREEVEAAEKDLYNAVDIPEDLEDMDDEALVGLPGNVQSEVFKQIKVRQRAKHREQMMLKQNDPSEFSNAQINGFLKNTALNRRISSVRKLINANSGASQRIASDNQRQYLLEEEVEDDDSMNEFEDDSDDDVLTRAARSKNNAPVNSHPGAPDLLSKIRASNSNSRSYIQWQEPEVQKETEKQQKSDSGVGWAAKVLQKQGGHVLGGSSTRLMNLKKSLYTSDDDSDPLESSMEENKADGCFEEKKREEKQGDCDSDSGVEWEDGDDRNNLNTSSSLAKVDVYDRIDVQHSSDDGDNKKSSALVNSVEGEESDEWEDGGLSHLEQDNNDFQNTECIAKSAQTIEKSVPKLKRVDDDLGIESSGTLSPTYEQQQSTVQQSTETEGFVKRNSPGLQDPNTSGITRNNLTQGSISSEANKQIRAESQIDASQVEGVKEAKSGKILGSPIFGKALKINSSRDDSENGQFVQYSRSRPNASHPPPVKLQNLQSREKSVAVLEQDIRTGGQEVHPEEEDHIQQAITLSLQRSSDEVVADPIQVQNETNNDAGPDLCNGEGALQGGRTKPPFDGPNEEAQVRTIQHDVECVERPRDLAGGKATSPAAMRESESGSDDKVTPEQTTAQQQSYETDLDTTENASADVWAKKSKSVTWEQESPDTNNQRKESVGSFSIEQAENLQTELEVEAANLRKQKASQRGFAESLSDEMYAETRDLIKLFGIPYLEAPTEAEAQCAFLNMHNVVDAIITEDSDAFLFGANVVYRHLFADGKFAEAYDRRDIATSLGLERNQLIQLALLLGSDYTYGVRGVGIVNSMEILEAFPGAEGLNQFREWTKKITVLDEKPEESAMSGSSTEAAKRRFCWKHRNVKRNWEIREDFPSPAVYDAYMKPVVNESKAKFKWGKVNFDGLAQFCWEKFGWGHDKFESTVGPLREELKARAGQQQRRIDEFFRPHRFAKIKSERLQKAVTGIAGEDAKQLMAPLVPRIGKRKSLAISHTAPELSDEELDEELMVAVNELETEAMRKRQKY